MPRFFFHLQEAEQRIQDDVGIELPDVQAALDYAEQAARDILSDEVRQGEVVDQESIQVIDESGALVSSLLVKSVVNFK